MDKVKMFLERYVEWLALALGVAFLGWTVWGSVLSKPVSVTVGSDATVEPGEIASKVWEGPGKEVDSQMKRADAPPSMTPAVDYPSVIVSRFSDVPSDVKTAYATGWTPPQPVIDDSIEPSKNGPKEQILVTQLPTGPAPVNLQFSFGHSNIQPPKTEGAAPLAGSVLAIDKNWITFQTDLPVKALADAFDAAKIPDKFAPVAIYRVIATRQEKDAAGLWGNETVIEPLEMNALMPLPKNDCTPDERQNYKTWAETQTNVVLIAEPPFYTVVHGSIWYQPGTPNPNETDTTTVVDTFDPKHPLDYKGDPNTLLPEDKAAYDKAKAAKDAADARRSRPTTPTPPPGSGLGRGGGGGGAGAGGGGRHAIPQPTPADGGGSLLRRPGNIPRPGPGNGSPYYPPARQPNGMDNPGPGATAGTDALPQGSFSPKDRLAAAVAAGVSPDIKIWVHDATVQAGKTYRYKMNYIISNPVAGTTHLCKDPAMEQQAYIISDSSKWSDPISVESDSNFYAVDNKHGIRFDIFKWKNGVWQMQTVQANPGDRIGTMDTTGSLPHTDFDTGWTLIDVREDPAGNNENKVLVMVSDTGNVRETEISRDRQSAEYRKLLIEVHSTADKTASR